MTISKRKIAVIGTVGVPANYGGFETLAENLLEDDGEPLLVYCSGYAHKERPTVYKNAGLIYLPIPANGPSSILYDIISILDAIRRGTDTLLVLGVSGALIFPIARALSNVRIVTNIDGLEHRRQKWSFPASQFLKLLERIAVRYSHTVIGDNQAIVEYVWKEYGVTAELIAYGGDHALSAKRSGQLSNYALCICRIEPENNIALILESFAKSSIPLKFVGNWENSKYGRNLRDQFGANRNIEFINATYDQRELFQLRDKCCLYVHGHSAGGTNPSLVEMMHFGCQIACYDCSYNRYTTEDGAYFFSNVKELSEILHAVNRKKITPSTSHLIKTASKRYTWRVIRKQYFDVLLKS